MVLLRALSSCPIPSHPDQHGKAPGAGVSRRRLSWQRRPENSFKAGREVTGPKQPPGLRKQQQSNRQRLKCTGTHSGCKHHLAHPPSPTAVRTAPCTPCEGTYSPEHTAAQPQLHASPGPRSGTPHRPPGGTHLPDELLGFAF